jgi:ATP/maltotriose-dependent transcriptional regulator MalT
MTAPTPVLETKLYAPTPRPQLVTRPRLAAELDAALDTGHRLTLVSAPAGFGKSTLLGEWLTHVHESRPDVRVAWLSLDEGDNDLDRLLTHVAAALRGVGLDVTVPGPSGLTALVNDIARAGARTPDHRWVLILDDYHVIGAAGVHDAMMFLLDHLPGQLHLLVATRADPPLRLARLRSRGQLTELRAADLRFGPAQTRDFLNRVMGLSLTPADVAALDGRTEGWVAGLQLAALSLRAMSERADVEGFIKAFAGSNRYVIDYLADEVLARKPADIRDFLLHTAVLERLTGPLCDAVTGRGDGTRMLEALERDNLFLVPLDDHRVWYRYHQLFADMLRVRLLAEHPDLVADLHRRAGDWYAGHDLVADAVRHALAAEDFVHAAHLMEGAISALRRARQDGLLLAWVGALPEPVLRRSPVLSILSAWSLMMSGDLDAAQARLDDAERALSAGADAAGLAVTWADTDELRAAPATISVYRASLAQARGDVPGTVRHARHAVDLAGPDDHLVRGAGNGFLGLAAWAAGDVPAALATFGDAVRSLHLAGNLVDELDSTIVLADMWLAAGRPGQARRLYEEALRSATGTGEPYPRATADLHVGLAELDRELDDLTGAEAHLESARVLGERGSITENRHRWSLATAQVHAARGDHDAALRLLDRAESLYRRGFYPDVRPIAAMKARVRIAAGDLAPVAAWADDRGLGLGADPGYLYEYEHLTLVRLRLAQNRDLGATVGLLDRLHTAASRAGRPGSLLEIGLLLALAHQANDDLPRALAVLERSVAEAPEPANHRRLYLDEGSPVRALLRHAATDGRSEAIRGWARQLLDREPAPDAGPPPLADPLSPRELQVLRLLGGELTGPEIARELYVSLNTLRSHTKRIFTKLDASTRATAVRRARERGLL